MRRRLPRRLVLLVIAVALGVLLGRWFTHRGPQPPSTPPPPVAIEDGKTIDFSSGQPVVRDDTAALEQARRELEAASANITFAPTKPPGTNPPDASTTQPPLSPDPTPLNPN